MEAYLKTVFKRDGGFVFRITSDQKTLVLAEMVWGPELFKKAAEGCIGQALCQGNDEFNLDIGIGIAVRRCKISLKRKVSEEFAKMKREKMGIFNQGKWPVQRVVKVAGQRVALIRRAKN